MAFVSLFRRQIRSEIREWTPRLELPRRSTAHRATLRRCRTTRLVGTGHAPETMQWRLATRGIATVGLLNSHSRHPLWLRAARAWRRVIRLLDARSDDPSAVQTFLACPTLEERLNGPLAPPPLLPTHRTERVPPSHRLTTSTRRAESVHRVSGLVRPRQRRTRFR